VADRGEARVNHRAVLLAVAAAAVSVLFGPAAVANGRFPASNQLVFSPTDARLVVLRTTFGILLSSDGGTTWSWLCEDALGVSSSSMEDPLLALTAAGSIVAGPVLSSGIFVSPNTGCDWNLAAGALTHQLAKDLAIRPDAPDVVLALTSGYRQDAGADGGPGYLTQVYQSTNDGTDWSALGVPIDPSALVTTIDVAELTPHPIYVSAFRVEGATRSASLFVSTDDGATWIERPAPLDPQREDAIYIAGVDPVTPDLVYVRTSGQVSSGVGGPSRLLVTNDGGRTYRAVLSLTGPMLGFALSADGSKVYAGSAEDGLFVATRAGLSFQHVSTIHVHCLATHGSDLWACSDEPSGFIAGVSSDDGATFTAKLPHLSAQPTIACAADASAAQCSGAPRQALCQLLPGCDADAGMLPAAGTKKGCGCSILGRHEGVLAVGAIGAIVGIGLGRVRKRARK
jgi:hypothetical protein